MKALKELTDKKIGLYIRKEDSGENLATGYGRLQWLRYELEEHEGRIETYIDNANSLEELKKLACDVIDGKIDVVLIWSIDELINVIGMILMLNCSLREIPIISFCESPERVAYVVEHQDELIEEVF
ncbi:hypothetical protein [Clostridium tyrobutyricum]|uniref:hypothetical protein n=1 Tax=Clostridium tyrobutyricum TaxID=1519 RepID=UPI00189E0C44|nr:hypothetical protein [Clostridium tyrobutyricum]